MRTWLAFPLLLAACDSSSDDDVGPSALSSAGYQPLTSFSCNVAVDLLSNDGLKETFFGYAVTAFSNGDMLTDCSVGLGGDGSAADSNYYPATSRLAADGSCSVRLDYPFPNSLTAGVWGFNIDRDDGPQAQYLDDPAHPLNGARYVFFENDCAVYVFDGRRWNDSSLGELLR